MRFLFTLLLLLLLLLLFLLVIQIQLLSWLAGTDLELFALTVSNIEESFQQAVDQTEQLVPQQLPPSNALSQWYNAKRQDNCLCGILVVVVVVASCILFFC